MGLVHCRTRTGAKKESLLCTRLGYETLSVTHSSNNSEFWQSNENTKLHLEKTIYSLTTIFGTVVPWTCIFKSGVAIFKL